MQEKTPSGSMYLVLPVPFRLADGELYVEAQAANGLDRWADHFERVTVGAPVYPEARLGQLAGVRWVPVAGLEHAGRIVCQQLPWAYSPQDFLRNLAGTRMGIESAIRRADHLQFAIGGLVGDWACVAARIARKLGRKYAIHTDRVEHEVMMRTAASGGGLRRMKCMLEAPVMKRYHRNVIRGCSLGLWHGEECFRAYSPWCEESHLIHDVHTKTTDAISAEELERKVAELRAGVPLRICYTGRLDPMKAPLEWLGAVRVAVDMGASLEATWFGEGAMLAEAQAECARLRLQNLVRFGGFVIGRAELLAAVREAHVLLFTHVTPESPRNLLEALVSGTPIVGFDSGYAKDLIGEFGGGAVVGMHDVEALGALVAELDRDRDRLAKMTLAAAANGRRFSDDVVFGERSDLIKRYA